jgi:hypothetical protein
VNLPEGIAAGTDALQQMTPSLPERRARHELRPRTTGAGDIHAQTFAQRRERKSPVAAFMEDPDSGKGAQQAI